MRHVRAVSAAIAALCLSGGALLAAPAAAQLPPVPRPPLTGHLLAINDFHGQLDPLSTITTAVAGTPAGGVEYLAHYVKERRVLDKASSSAVFTVAAGDTVGKSSLDSRLFHDEPAIEEMNSLGLDVAGVGDHEFDEGVSELLRLQHGGCHPVDGCQDGDGFRGASYPMLAANVVYQKNNVPVLPPFTIKLVGKVPVGFVGVTLKDTPASVIPAGIRNVKFLDEVSTANFYAKVLKALGVKAVVLLLHQGGAQSTAGPPPDPNGCAGFGGPVTDIVKGLDPAYGIVVSGHTHQWYSCALPNSSGATSLVTSAGSAGRLFTDITFQVDQATRKFTSVAAQNVIVANGVPTNGGWAGSGGFFLLDRVVGSTTADIDNQISPTGESPMGDVVADGLLAYTRQSGAQIALIGPQQVRRSLVYDNSQGGEAPGEVTYGEALNVQPIEDLVVTLSYTGAQLKEVLEQQFAGYAGQNATRILQVSQGFTYTYDSTLPLGARVSDLALDGTPLDPAATYRVTANAYEAGGGDGFTNLGVGTNRQVASGFDIDALIAHLATGPIAPGPVDRIHQAG